MFKNILVLFPHEEDPLHVTHTGMVNARYKDNSCNNNDNEIKKQKVL